MRSVALYLVILLLALSGGCVSYPSRYVFEKTYISSRHTSETPTCTSSKEKKTRIYVDSARKELLSTWPKEGYEQPDVFIRRLEAELVKSGFEVSGPENASFSIIIGEWKECKIAPLPLHWLFGWLYLFDTDAFEHFTLKVHFKDECRHLTSLYDVKLRYNIFGGIGNWGLAQDILTKLAASICEEAESFAGFSLDDKVEKLTQEQPKIGCIPK